MKGLCILALVCVAAASQSDICEQPLEYGVCGARFPRYGYNSTRGSCQLFFYSGCHGNENNFETLEACKKVCDNNNKENGDYVGVERRSGAGARLSCHQEPESGPCMANIPRYAYDHINNKCRPFIYGGCGGNANNFEDEVQCMMICGSVGGVASKREANGAPRCNLPQDPGPCEAYVPSFYYNSQSGSCEEFIYGGCEGNPNRFSSQRECMMACGGNNQVKRESVEKACFLPPNPGPCMAYFPRYYYNARSGRCEMFIYGGCGGNGNRFSELQECVHTCSNN